MPLLTGKQSFASIALALTLIFLFPVCVFAATIVLHDGSVIHGEVSRLQGGIYTIETDSLGTISVPKEDVRSIDLSNASQGQSSAPGSGATPPAAPMNLEAIQMQLMQNTDMFSMIQALQNDPQVLAVLSDPEVMNAMASGDINTLMNHPKIIALTQNPKVREIIEGAQ